MKLALNQQVPNKYEPAQWQAIILALQTQINLLAEGRLTGRHFTATSIPTTGDFAKGDIVWDSAPAEAGAAASKYVRLGWICTVTGSPGTLLEMRVLTGN